MWLAFNFKIYAIKTLSEFKKLPLAKMGWIDALLG